jgi:hypothetical protein
VQNQILDVRTMTGGSAATYRPKESDVQVEVGGTLLPNRLARPVASVINKTLKF